MQNQKGIAPIIIILIAVVVVGAITGGYFVWKRDQFVPQPSAQEKPIIQLKVEPAEISKGGAATLTWSAEKAVSCEASSPTAPDLPLKLDWQGNVGLSGTKIYKNVPHDLEFELTCKNAVGISTLAKTLLRVSETANWQTYRNEKYGFEVKYPPEWIVNTFEEPGITTVIQILSPSAQKGPKDTHLFGPAFGIRVIHNSVYEPKISGKNITFVGKSAVDSGWRPSELGGVPVRDIKILTNPVITIYLGGTLETSQKSEEAFLERILSTFKFIEQ